MQFVASCPRTKANVDAPTIVVCSRGMVGVLVLPQTLAPTLPPPKMRRAVVRRGYLRRSLRAGPAAAAAALLPPPPHARSTDMLLCQMTKGAFSHLTIALVTAARQTLIAVLSCAARTAHIRGKRSPGSRRIFSLTPPRTRTHVQFKVFVATIRVQLDPQAYLDLLQPWNLFDESYADVTAYFDNGNGNVQKVQNAGLKM